jgi:hypothetical protein
MYLQTPMVVKKMLSGQAVQWDLNTPLPTQPPPIPGAPPTSGGQNQPALQQVATNSLALLPETLGTRVSKLATAARVATEKGPGKMGVYRDKQKWVSIVSLPSALPISTSTEVMTHQSASSALETVSTGNEGTKLFFVGRHDSEEEAMLALKKARREVAVTGSYVYKRPASNISNFVQSFTANNLT